MGFFRRISERIREFFTREPVAPEPTDDDDGGEPGDSDFGNGWESWDGWDITDAYYVVEAAIDDMDDRGSI